MHPSPDPIRLLIIDDDRLIRTMIAVSLKTAGFEVSEAGDGASGFEKSVQCRPDLILLDVMMPGMDGYEVCGKVRAHHALARIPVIMLTGLDDPASIERSYEAGATDFIAKPINATLLVHRIRYALRANRLLGEIDRNRASLANAQRIARMGSWSWSPGSARFECSAEYRQVIDVAETAQDYQWGDILRQVHPDDLERVRRAMDAATASGEGYAIVYSLLRRDGSKRTVHEQSEVFRDADGRVMRIEGTTQDITDRIETEERIRQLADYDALTGLPNRKLFGEIMQRGLNRSRRQNFSAAVLDINLDRFKRINETLGHALGDQVLQEVGRRIAHTIRGSDIATTSHGDSRMERSARMSGDGFAVFLSEIRRAEDAAIIARRLHEAIAQPMRCGEHELRLTASTGIAVFPENGEEAGTLLKNAESAVHGAKARGVGTYCYFTPAMNARARAKLDTENELRNAIERDELVLFFQARVDVPSGRVVGAEALVRWQHPRRGLVPPGEFIPVAEESGLVVPMTAWVIEAACRQLRQWQDAGLPMVPVSINLSAHSFREDGLDQSISATLRKFGIAASLLEGEITESMMMQNVENAVTRLHQLRDIGIELALDDFGTGYSSLAYLKRFPLQALKIDRAFVKDVLTDAHDAAIASSIITLGKAMGMAVVAEGMERVEQANFLLARGCRLMQGFLFARPVAAAEFTRMLRTGLAMPPGLRVAPDEPGTTTQPCYPATDPENRQASLAFSTL